MNPTDEYVHAREAMIKRQLLPRGIYDPKVLAAMRKVPRHLFVEEAIRDLAYEDRPLPIGHQQTISQPYMVALMTEAMELAGDEKVLEIGTGSGYQAAVLAEICREVCTIEKHPALQKKAAALLAQLGYRNIVTRTGDGTLGWPEQQPFDAILVTAGAPEVPQPLLEQLAMGGRLLIPVGGDLIQELVKLTRHPGRIARESLVGCQFVPLVGKFGWRETS